MHRAFRTSIALLSSLTALAANLIDTQTGLLLQSISRQVIDTGTYQYVDERSATLKKIAYGNKPDPPSSVCQTISRK